MISSERATSVEQARLPWTHGFLSIAAATALVGFSLAGAAADPPDRLYEGWIGATQIAQTSGQEGEGASDPRSFDITPQPLSSALTQFGRQAGLEIAVDSAAVSDLRTQGVQGRYSPEEALSRLLAGTDLGYRFNGTGAVTLQRAEVEEDSGPVRLGPVKVYGARTTQTLNDVTSSVGIVSDQEIDRRELRNFRDTFRLLGNVRDADFNDAGFIIRGLNSEGLTPGGAPLASFYVDGIQQTIQGTRRGARGLWDVEQVEVYRGPQSTVAGRAALAGAIYVKTKDPSFDYEVAGRGTFGEDDRREGAAMVNLPLFDKQLAFRFTGEYQRSESDINYPTYDRFDRFDDLRENEFFSFRGKALLEPMALPDTRALFTYSYSEDAPDQRDIAGPALGFEFDEERGDFNTPNFAEVRRTEVQNLGLEITHDISDSLTFTSQTGYSRSDTDRPSVNAGTAGETDFVVGDFVQDLATQEFRLNYFGEQVDGTLGLYGAYESEDAGFRRPDFFGFASDISKTDQESWNGAVFGEVTFEFYPSWKVVGGARVDYTEQEGSSFFSRNDVAITDFSFERDETVFLPKAGLIKEFGPNHSTGFVVQRGFRAGGATVQRSTGMVFDFDSELAWNYELFYKGTLFNDRLRLSANAFYLDIQDQQIEVQADPTDPASTFTSNAAESRAVGFELEAQASITEELSSFVSVGFVETEFKEFDLPGVEDLSGDPFPEAPNWSIAAGAFFEHPSGVFLGADVEYTDNFMARIGTTPQDNVQGYFLANAQAGFRYENVTATVFAENIFDKEYFVFEDNDIASTLGRGRFVGVSVDVAF